MGNEERSISPTLRIFLEGTQSARCALKMGDVLSGTIAAPIHPYP